MNRVIRIMQPCCVIETDVLAQGTETGVHRPCVAYEL